MAPALGSKAAGAQRESRSLTVLQLVTLIVVALIVASQYPRLLARFSRDRDHAAADTRRRLKSGVGAASIAAAAAGPPAAPGEPDTVWTPRCQLEEDRAPSHGNKSFVDISVSSEFDMRSRRDAIRAGYAKYARELGMRVRFFVGQAEADDEHGRLSRASESKQFGDLVILPMVDTYENLTLKTMGMAVYTSKCGNGDFYVKTDDDVFVYPWRLQKRLEKVTYEESMYKTRLGVYLGNFWIDSRPIRESWHKNYESKWKGEHYGPYAAGPFYILSKGAVDFLGDNAARLNWKWRNEDMAMGTWMAGADVEFVNDWHIKILNWKHYEQPLIAEHNIDDRERIEAWHTELAFNFSHPDPPPPVPKDGDVVTTKLL